MIGSLRERLAKTRRAFTDNVAGVFRSGRFDDEMWEVLEESLIAADIGAQTAIEAVGQLRERVRREKPPDEAAAMALLKEVLRGMMAERSGLCLPPDGLGVILAVGVNGTGKTTTIAKLAHHLQGAGRKVVIAAADTYRAAAIEQLESWGLRLEADVFSHQRGADPAAVAFDAVGYALGHDADVLIVDTAGRLHTRDDLMAELVKIKRVIGKMLAGAPHETLMVIDATTGQNGISQARAFNEKIGLDGIILSKLDGTARGGVVIPVENELGVPVKFIGIGEGKDDLEPFDPDAFLDALLAPTGGDS